MVTLPLYDPGGTQRVTPVRPVQVNEDMFGAGIGRAAANVGQALQVLGGRMMQIEKEEREKDDAAKTLAATSEASGRMRHALFGQGGLYERTGANAEGVAQMAQATAEQIRRDVSKNLSTPEQQQAFERVWAGYSDTTMNSVAKFEFDQRRASRTAAKTGMLQNITDDVIANYNDEEMLRENITLARRTIRSNPDGLPEDAVAALERDTVSNLHLAVIQRMALDSPGRALDYYTRHKGEVNGVDHAEATKMIGQIQRIRDVRDFVQQTVNAGPANDIVSAVIGAESSGDPAAVSPAGAAGLMQLMPGTAREQALLAGKPHVAQMSDDELQAYWKTPEGRQTNVELGRGYLGRMLERFSKNGQGDIEAALIAYNAGPANAEKWLNAGRDYDVLPKKGETLPYVQKVLGAWRGIDFTGASTSQDMQARLNGSMKAYYDGDAKAFLKQRLQSQHGAQHIDGMTPELSDRLAALFNDAPDFVKEGLDILSGYRSNERQSQLYANKVASVRRANPDWSDAQVVAEARKWVAPPGSSQHNHGRAADLGWNGGRFASAPKEVRDWVHANAASYGLGFPMGHEPWHIETAEARGKGGRLAASDPNSQRVAGAFAAAEGGDDASGFVSVAQSPGDAANVYLDAVSPFTVEVGGGSLEAALSAARERYADDPSALAEAERQITNKVKGRENATKAQVDEVKRQLLAGLLNNGQSPRDADPNVLSAIGPEAIKQLFSLEDDIRQGGTRFTDDATYIELTQMDPAQFRDVDLMQYAPNLSRADLQKFADRQADLRQGSPAAMNSAMQSRQQIVGNAATILGLEPTKDADDAATLAQLNRRLDTEIAGYVQREGKQPDGQTIQKMVDDLLMQGQKQSGIIGFRRGTTDRLFQVSPEELDNFYAASTVDDIPVNVRSHVALTYRSIFNVDPDETAAVNIYNDMIRVQAGGAPVPPADFTAQARQRFAARFGRPPLPDEIAEIYRKTLIRAAGAQNANQ